MGIITLTVLENGGKMLNSTMLNNAIIFLKHQIVISKATHIIIQVHCSMYTTGNHAKKDRYKEFIQLFEQTVDVLDEKRIRAVFYGHEHQASIFIRNGILYADCAPAGAKP